ncbi:hypothetical protein ACYT4N_10375 [Lactococcus lactis]|uniref:hypothetical protein n=1 Tax=Lactococcus lactis TaxID=1358 RepID=UPI0022E9878A|nr:hypothetical protein [Lactococcus lactis]MDA2898478.1 hypothetical protein [Lactococcus lactis]
MSDTPKFLSKQELELQEVNYIFSLRAERDELQEQINTAKKALTEISEIIDDDIHECNYGCDNHCELNGSLNMYSVENLKSVTESALAEIGGDK